MEGGWIAFNILAVLVAVWKPFFGAYMGEKGKRLATKEDIERVLVEVRLVTREQETIKASISGDLWNRQMVLTQKRDLYVRVLRVLTRLLDRHAEVVGYITLNGLQPKGVEIFQQILELQSELCRLCHTAEIFGSNEFCEPLREYCVRRMPAQTDSIAWPMREREEIRKLSDRLVIAAKLDLNPNELAAKSLTEKSSPSQANLNNCKPSTGKRGAKK